MRIAQTSPPEPSASGQTGAAAMDSAGPGSHRFYVVSLPEEDSPGYVQITQCMMLPH